MKIEKEITPEILPQMPEPQFLDIPSPFPSGDKPIGIIAKSPIDGKEKFFIYWKYFNYVNQDKNEGRSAVATYVTRLILSHEAEIVIGPAVDLEKSDVKTGKIKALPKPKRYNKYGYYIESSRRRWFGVAAALKAPETVDDLMGISYDFGHPKLFDETFEKVKASLPDLK